MRDSFYEKKVCDRCGGNLSTRIMSKMNEDVICSDCSAKEKKHPKYKEASDAEFKEVQKGNYNYRGLFADQKYPFGYEVLHEEVCCSEKDCKISTPYLIITIDDGKEKIALCPNHSIGYVLGMIPEDTMKKYPSDTRKEQVCEICGDAGALYKDGEAEFKLCKKHLESLLKRALKPEEFKKLYSRVGNVYILHDDFYDPDTGEAIQPVE